MKNKLVYSFLFLFYAIVMQAGKQEWVVYLDKADITNGATLTITDSTVYNQNNWVRSAKAKVRLVYTREDRSDIHDPGNNEWAYTVDYSIISGVSDPLLQPTNELSLLFGIAEAYKYENIQTHNLAGMSVTLAINNVISVPFGIVPDDIKLELILEVETYCEGINTISPSPDCKFINNEEQLLVFWDYIECAEEYELEYVFVDSCTYIPDKVDFLNQLFDGMHNEVRITTSNQYYTLDMHYPSGSLFLRLRGIKRFTDDVNGDYTHQKYGWWSTYKEVTISKSFEPQKMWQVVSTFAEDGKFKKVNTFVDGSGRTRQVLTNLSSDRTIIVGETKYDDEGRAALSFMPVPVPGTNLAYRPLFNLPSSTPQYNKSLYRIFGQPAEAASPAIGAAQYYSADINSPAESIHKAYIPDAEGYPFSQTQYDGLGRPKLQGGVGPMHQIGSGHETKYFYAGTNSTELRRLFGSNVGRAKHYSKDVVIDANGQVSIAYKDLADRTIATALAGESPENVLPLSYNTSSKPIVVNLNESNIIDQTLGISYAQSTIMNIRPNSFYSFAYGFQGVINEIGVPYEICPTCEYIIEINISGPEDCHNPDENDINLTILDGKTPEFITNSSLKDTIQAALLQDCENNFPVYELLFQTNFKEIGEYTITKTLKVSETSLENFMQSIITSEGLPDSSEIIQAYINLIDSTACEIELSNDSLVEAVIDTIGGVECDNLLETLKNDIRPGGVKYDAGEYSFEKEDELVKELSNYCEYIHCRFLTDSRTYDLQGQRIKGWMEARNLGTMPNLYNIDFTDPINTDPGVNNYLIYVPGNGCTNYKAQLQDYLTNNAFTFKDETGNSNTIIGLENYAHYLASIISGNNGQQIPAPFDELKWQLYRGYYQAKKQEIIRAFQAQSSAICNPYGVCETPEPCPPASLDTLVIDVGTIFNGNYLLGATFVGSVPIQEYGEVTVQAGESIILRPGFSVKSGSRFRGFINPISTSLVDCDDDPRAAVFNIESAQDLYDLMADATDYLGLADCEGACDTTVMTWMSVLNFNCDTLSTAQRKIDSLTIAKNLKAFCRAKCTDFNPLVFLKESDWASTAAPFNSIIPENLNTNTNTNNYDLSLVQNILSQYCTDSLYKDITLGEVCTIDTTVFTNNIVSYNIDNCIYPLITGMNNALFSVCDSGTGTGTGTFSGIVNPDFQSFNTLGRLGVPPNCWPNYHNTSTTIRWYPSSSSANEMVANTVIAGAGFSCTFLTLFKEDGTKISLHDISNISPPIRTTELPVGLRINENSSNGEVSFQYLKAEIQDKHCDNYTVYFYGNCLNFVEMEEQTEKVTSIDTTCLCQPPQVELKIADYYKDCIDQRVAEARYNAMQHWNHTVAQLITDVRKDYECLPSLETMPCFSLDFSEAEDYVEIANDPMGQINPNNFTFETWIKGENSNQPATPVLFSNRSGGQGCMLFFHPPISPTNHKLIGVQMAEYNFVTLTTPDILDGNFHHIAFVHEFPNVSIYIDGELAGTRVSNNDRVAPLTSNALLRIGQEAGNPSSTYFNGLIKDIRIWKVSRTANQIQYYMNRQLTGTEDGLVAYYDMNEGEGQTLKDKTGNNHNGQLGESPDGNTSDPLWVEDCSPQIEHDAGFDEIFWTEYLTREYHYTLYQYDQAGNLVRTIPPEAVVPADIDIFTDFTGPRRDIYIGPEPNHNYDLASTYQFNSWNQPIQQESPDGGKTIFYYDDKGQLRLSQNAQQRANETAYSYSKYDGQGRPIEVGQIDNLTNFTTEDLNNSSFPDVNDYVLSEIVVTTYDQDSDNTYVNDRNLRGRVAEVRRLDTEKITHSILSYDYDPHGNVKRLLQKAAFLDPKEVTYSYDQISGNVNEVCFQQGKQDQYAHRFAYDADNRLTDVWTSKDEEIWEHDARYFYYAHGPLARVELGEDIVQGLDYYYTLHGWLKGMNLPEINGINDPGKDAYNLEGNLNRWTGRDTVSFALGYYQGDYQPKNTAINLGATSINKSWNQFSKSNYILGATGKKGLFNGNIAWMMTDIPENGSGSQLQAMAYKYDQLHRIKNANGFSDYNIDDGWVSRINSTEPQPYDANYSYDKNGNLQTLNRWGQNATQIDALRYTYENGNTQKKSNQLIALQDDAGNQNENDLDEFHEYTYDNIGNLKTDLTENIADIDWYVDGKVKEITFIEGQTFEDGKPKLAIAFKYDGMGNRIQKILKKGPTQVDWVIHHYSRDPQGNILAVYEQTFEQVVIPPTSVDLELNMTCSQGPAQGNLGLKPKFDITITNNGPGDVFTAEIYTPLTYSYPLTNHELLPENGASPYISHSTQGDTIIWTVTNLPVHETLSFSVAYEPVWVFNTTQTAYIQTSSVADPDSTSGTPTGEDDEATCTSGPQ